MRFRVLNSLSTAFACTIIVFIAIYGFLGVRNLTAIVLPQLAFFVFVFVVSLISKTD